MRTENKSSIQVLTSIEKGHVVTGLLSNFLLIFLIVTRSRKSLGSYKYLLLVTYCITILTKNRKQSPQNYGLAQRLQVVSVGTTFASVSWSILESRVIAQFNILVYNMRFQKLTSLYCASFTVPFILMIIHFLYRFWAVKHPARIVWFSNKYFIALLTAVNLSGFLTWYSICVYGATGAVDEIGTIIAREEYKRRYGRTITDGYIVMDHWRGGKLNLRAAIVMFSLDGILFSSILIASSLAILTLRCISQADKMSIYTKLLQRQLLTTLIVQTVLPVLFVYLPYLAILTCPFFDIPDFGLSTACTALNSGFPTWDAFVVIIFVRDYRSALTRVFKLMTKPMEGSNPSMKTVAVSVIVMNK